MKVRYLLDENLPPRLKTAILRLNPAIDVLRVGEAGSPSSGTPDPEILCYMEQTQRILVTSNRKSMPAHLEAHRVDGGKLPGLFWIRSRVSLHQLAQELLLVWEASDAEEWADRTEWIPFHV